MRIKDKSKEESVIAATIKLVNKIGFASSSVAKIAKEANVSPATIYIYYKNKEDLLTSTYIDIKKQLSNYMLTGFDSSKPIRDIFEHVWQNTFRFIANNKELFYFTEQFANSPYSDKIDKAEIDMYFEPLFNLLQKGIEQKIIKNVHYEILGAFIFYPVLILANNRLCKTIKLTDKTIKSSFTLAWDAIKL